MSDRILNKKEKIEETRNLENKIDLIVYKLYQLTYDEIKIVDPDIDKVLSQFGLSKDDYEKLGVEEIVN